MSRDTQQPLDRGIDQDIDQEIRFCAAADGTRLACATSGAGMPLVKSAHWLTHLGHDWTSPLWRHQHLGLSRRYRLLRYDQRGCGLSDRDAGDMSLETWVGDLERVVDSAGLQRFVLLGESLMAYHAAGAALVFAGIVLTQYGGARWVSREFQADRE